MTTASGITITPFDVRNLTDQEIADINELQNAQKAEARPEDPPTPLEETTAFIRNLPEFVDVWGWGGRDASDRLVAGGQAFCFNTGENAHVLNVEINVRPQVRRRGVARELLGLVAAVAEAKGKTLLMGNTNERLPQGAAFCERVGASPGLNAHTNRLVLADVDSDLVRRWVKEGPERAPEYELVGFDGACPDDLVEAVVDVLDVMNDAPRDELALEDRKGTVDQFRDLERMNEAQGAERWWLFAKQRETDQLIGLTDVAWNPNQPETVFQGNTGVRPEHRGKAVGKWLKATMLERILAERPTALDIRTGNADSNAAMLAINHQLGFGPYIASTTWQVGLDKVKAYLAS